MRQMPRLTPYKLKQHQANTENNFIPRARLFKIIYTHSKSHVGAAPQLCGEKSPFCTAAGDLRHPSPKGGSGPSCHVPWDWAGLPSTMDQGLPKGPGGHHSGQEESVPGSPCPGQTGTTRGGGRQKEVKEVITGSEGVGGDSSS